MGNNVEKRNASGTWALMGIAVIPMLCCGLSTLIGALGFTAAGAVLAASRFWIAGGVVIAIAIVMFLGWRKSKKFRTNSSCTIASHDLSERHERS